MIAEEAYKILEAIAEINWLVDNLKKVDLAIFNSNEKFCISESYLLIVLR